MNRDGQITPAHDRKSDASAYALGALDRHEADEFGRHLDGCPTCRDDLNALQRVADVLPMSAPQQAVPPRLRRRVMRSVHADARRGPRTKRSAPARWAPPVLVRGPRLVLASALMAVVLAAAAIGVSGLVSGGSGGTRAIDAQVFNSAGSAQLRINGGRGMLVVQHLPPPPAGRIYEVWLQMSNRPPAPTKALFSVTAAGDADVDVPGDLTHVARILVTQEPAGGSLVSTRPPLIVAPLT